MDDLREPYNWYSAIGFEAAVVPRAETHAFPPTFRATATAEDNSIFPITSSGATTFAKARDMSMNTKSRCRRSIGAYQQPPEPLGQIADIAAKALQHEDTGHRKRFRLNHTQTRYLVTEFARKSNPDAAHRARLSREIAGLSPRQVQVWFQNRRAKLKRLTNDDRECMLRSSVLPIGFDMKPALQTSVTVSPSVTQASAHRSPSDPMVVFGNGLEVPCTIMGRAACQIPQHDAMGGQAETLEAVSSTWPRAASGLCLSPSAVEPSTSSSLSTRSHRSDQLVRPAGGILAPRPTKSGDCHLNCWSTQPNATSDMMHPLHSLGMLAEASSAFRRAQTFYDRSAWWQPGPCVEEYYPELDTRDFVHQQDEIGMMVTDCYLPVRMPAPPPMAAEGVSGRDPQWQFHEPIEGPSNHFYHGQPP